MLECFQIFSSDLSDNIRFNNINNLINWFTVAQLDGSGKDLNV